LCTHNSPPTEDDPSSWPQWTTTELVREASDEFLEAAYATAATSEELSRNLAHAHHARFLAVSQAKAIRQQAVDSATEDKTYSLALLEDDASSDFGLGTLDFGPGKEHDAVLAGITLTHTTVTEDAKLAFQEDETDSRGQYSLNLATAQDERDLNLAANAQLTALTEANYQYGADAAFASAEEADWSHETSIDNTVALAKAQADVALWTAEESATVSAVQSIDTLINSPWTQYLVGEAQAHRNWWGLPSNPNSQAAKFINSAIDQNSAAKAEQDAVNAAHHTNAINLKAYRTSHTQQLIIGQYQQAVDTANAHFNYVASLISPAQTYLNSLAQTDHDLAVNLAQLSADKAAAELEGEDDWESFDELQVQYQQSHQQADQEAVAAYDEAEASAMADQMRSLAAAQRAAAENEINGDYQAAGLELSANVAFDVSEAEDKRAYAHSIAHLMRAYFDDSVTTWATAAAGLATDFPSPWATYAVSSAGADKVMQLASDEAHETLDDATADADATASEIESASDAMNQAADDVDKANTATTVTESELGIAEGQAEVVEAAGQSETYPASFPPVEPAPSPADAIGAALAGVLIDGIKVITGMSGSNGYVIAAGASAAWTSFSTAMLNPSASTGRSANEELAHLRRPADIARATGTTFVGLGTEETEEEENPPPSTPPAATGSVTGTEQLLEAAKANNNITPENAPQQWLFKPRQTYNARDMAQLLAMGVVTADYQNVDRTELDFPRRWLISGTNRVTGQPLEGINAPYRDGGWNPMRAFGDFTRKYPICILEIKTASGSIKFLYINDLVVDRDHGSPDLWDLVGLSRRPGSSDSELIQQFTIESGANIKAAQRAVARTEFIGSFVPGFTALDNLVVNRDGDVTTGVIAAIGDGLLLAGAVAKVGGNIGLAAKVATASYVFENGIGAIKVGQSAYYVINGDNIKAQNAAAEAAMRLLGAQLIRPSLGSKVATREIVDLGEEEAMHYIDRFRSRVTGLEPLGDIVPERGDGLGTVALVKAGRKFCGVNSSLLSDASKDLGREFFDFMKGKGYFADAAWYGQSSAQVLTHAEAIALMRAWRRSAGKMPADVTLYVDRYTCANCRKHLGEVAEVMGIERLTIIDKLGDKVMISVTPPKP
jgi:tRNA-specific A34 adenosine deaminase